MKIFVILENSSRDEVGLEKYIVKTGYQACF